jgi:cephalosporin hydroxylase
MCQRAAEAFAIAGAANAVRRAHRGTRDEAIDFAERFEYGGITIRPMQVREEIRQFLVFLEPQPLRAVIEIGTGRGGTSFLLAHVAADNALVLTIDAPTDTSFGGRPAYKRRGRLYRSLGRSSQRVAYLAADSHSPETRRKVTTLLAGTPLDLLCIDGDHSYEGVRADFTMYSSLVRRGGFVALNDIVPGEAAEVGGVPAFWRELRADDSLEFVEDWSQGGHGIGVLSV